MCALAPLAVRNSDAPVFWNDLAPSPVLVSEAALLRPSAVSAALSQMLADPSWQRGLHPRLQKNAPDPLIRRVEYCQPREPTPRRRPRSNSAHAQEDKPPAAPSQPGRPSTAERPRSCSRSSSQAQVPEAGEPNDGSFVAGRAVVRRGVAAQPASSSRALKPPIPRADGSRPLPRPPRRQQSLEMQGPTDEEMGRRCSSSSSADCDAAEAPSATSSMIAAPPPRPLRKSPSGASSRPPSAGTRPATPDRSPGSWPTPSRARKRPSSLGRSSSRVLDEEGNSLVPTIRAPQ